MTLSTLENKMDPTKTLLGRMLLEEITPLVMVLCTPSVEESCQKNGLTFLQMLLPFCFFNKIDVPVRTASDQPYRLQMFKLRLAYASDICQQNIEVAKENMKRVVSGASDQALLDLQSDSEPFESIHKTLESKSLPAWFQIFNKELIRTLSFSEHETFDHPVACLLVVSSKDVQPINKFVDLFNTDQLPSLLSDGAMDPKLLKYYLLLHDNQDGPMEKASNILADMRGTFGSSDCRLLCINSGEGTDRESDGNPWSSYINYSFEGQSIGCFIDVNDINEIKDLMQDFSSKHIIPYMEQKIRMLNQQVSATRKGLRNQIKNLWWRKGKEDITDDPHGPMYTFSSPEFQIRVLGDYAFMLRDYELALSNYRLLSTDYKLDKAWKQYAGVQEMAGLSYFMLDQSRKDAEYCMETAFNTYMRNGYSGHRNATRCGLWWAEMLKSWGHYREAAGIYFRISIEEATLHAAVMLEQSSYCYLNCDPPMLRKYGYHLVLAGNRYEFSDQRKHALRTYKNALSVYKGGVWKYINDHVNYKIGRWYSLHGLFDVSIRHLLEILACSHQPSHTQELFLKDFYHVVQNLGKTFKVYQLQLPIINMQSLNVIFEDHRTYASPSSVCIKESVWQCLEEELVPSTSTVRTNWLDSHSKPSAFKKYKDSAICVFGEAITVELEFKNPLQTAISVSAISLLCELSASSDVAISDDCESEAANESSELFEEKMEQDVDNSSYSLSKVELTLQGGETKVVQLKVIPTEEGFFKIVGVRWTLSGLVIGYHKFDSDPPKRKLVKKKAAQGPSKPTLKFVVIKEFPKLDGCICKLPRKAYVGDFRRLSLELTNGSEYCIKNLKMMISHPKCIIPGRVKDMDMEFPACLEKQMDSETDVEQISVSYKPNGSLVLFPKDTTIQSGATFLWPLWFHAGISGNMSLYISIYYEVENCSSEMKHRTLRMHYEIEVLPSLDVSIQITPYQSGLQEFLVRMDINNMTSSDNFSLRQLSTIQNQWTISSLLPDASICPSNVVLADQALSCFFKLQDSGEISVMEDSSPSLRRLKGSDIMLDPQRSREPLNISRSPFINFFKQGGLQQNAQMESPNMIDLILISAPEENCGSFDPRGLLDMSQLFSHHLCLSRIMNTCPIWWIVDGPQVLYHDFFSSFCEISLRMTIHNCTNSSAKIKISTSDHMWPGDLSGTQANELSSEGRKSVVGWHDISITNDVEVSSDSKGSEGSADTGISPFVWSGSSSTWVTVDPLATAEIPLQICVFSPGTYNISNYTLHWSLQLSDDQVSTGGDAVRQSSGINRGHPFYLSVLQSA